MAKTREQKATTIAKLRDAVVSSPSVAFVHFKGITVPQITELRKTLREAGIGYFVAKKSLIEKSFEGSKVGGAFPALGGEIAVAYTTTATDITAPARMLYDLGKKLGKDAKLKLEGGVFEGSFLDLRGIAEIASIPPAEQLRGMFANVINSPLQRFAVALSEVAKIKA
jgi:large subunit ribosomal protein L10